MIDKESTAYLFESDLNYFQHFKEQIVVTIFFKSFIELFCIVVCKQKAFWCVFPETSKKSFYYVICK